jgi:integrase
MRNKSKETPLSASSSGSGQTEDEARKVTTLTEGELSRVLRAADEHYPDHADPIYLLAWTGLRISEACGLLPAASLIVGAPKSGKSRRVDLPEALVVCLRGGGDSGRARQSISRPTSHVRQSAPARGRADALREGTAWPLDGASHRGLLRAHSINPGMAGVIYAGCRALVENCPMGR